MSFFKKFKFEESIGKYIEKELKIEEIVKNNLNDKDDIFLRSKKYSILKKMYDEYFEGKIDLSK